MAKRSASLIISHWYQLIEGLEASPKAFYTSVEEAVGRRQLPKAELHRIDWPEGGLLSPKREYLRVGRGEHTFDVCGAPFGNGFFVSWWLGEIPSGCLNLLVSIPIVGGLFERLVRPATYYRIDTALMFQSAVHAAVMEVVDGLTKAKGLRALSESERKPMIKGFFGT